MSPFEMAELLARVEARLRRAAHGRRPRGGPPAKLEPDPREPRYILTVHGLGYKFAG